MTKTKKNKQISYEEFNTVLNGLELLDIRLIESSSALIERGVDFTDLKVSFDNSSSYENIDSSTTRIIESFEVRIFQSKPAVDFVKITAKFRLSFASLHPFTEEFFLIYRDYSLKLNSWPYFREFVQSITNRMNIPPLTLPLFKPDSFDPPPARKAKDR